jgi:hypothetical protein
MLATELNARRGVQEGMEREKGKQSPRTSERTNIKFLQITSTHIDSRRECLNNACDMLFTNRAYESEKLIERERKRKRRLTFVLLARTFNELGAVQTYTQMPTCTLR